MEKSTIFLSCLYLSLGWLPWCLVWWSCLNKDRSNVNTSRHGMKGEMGQIRLKVKTD